MLMGMIKEATKQWWESKTIIISLIRKKQWSQGYGGWFKGWKMMTRKWDKLKDCWGERIFCFNKTLNSNEDNEKGNMIKCQAMGQLWGQCNIKENQGYNGTPILTMDNDFPNITIVIFSPFLSFHHSFWCSRCYSIVIPNASGEMIFAFLCNPCNSNPKFWHSQHPSVVLVI